MYILYIVTNDTLKKGSAFIINDRDFFAMYILYNVTYVLKYIHFNIFGRFGQILDYNEYIQTLLNFFIMRLLQFDDNELETIVAALDDYVNYHDEDLSEDELIGGISVLDRVNSINDKINEVY